MNRLPTEYRILPVIQTTVNGRRMIKGKTGVNVHYRKDRHKGTPTLGGNPSKRSNITPIIPNIEKRTLPEPPKQINRRNDLFRCYHCKTEFVGHNAEFAYIRHLKRIGTHL